MSILDRLIGCIGDEVEAATVPKRLIDWSGKENKAVIKDRSSKENKATTVPKRLIDRSGEENKAAMVPKRLIN
jgi:hypothetical protein